MLMTVMTMSLALAAPPQAVTSNCGWENGRWVCRDVRPPAPVNPVEETRRAQEWVDNMFRQQEARLQQPTFTPPIPSPDEERQLVRRTVGRLILDGECRRAISTALENGEVALAVEARDFCEPSPRPPEPTP